MRSPPLLLLLLVVLGFAALAVPLTRLTQARPAVAAARSSQTPGGPVPTLIRFRFAHQPVELSLRQGDRVVVTVSKPSENPTESNTSLVVPAEGVEFLVEARWPAGTPSTALTVEIEPDGLEARSATWWTDTAGLTEVASFSWR